MPFEATPHFHCEAKDLPVLSAQFADIVQALSDENLNLHSLAQRIAPDPVLTGRFLKVANSSFFGMERQIASVEEAVTVIGLGNARSLVVATLVVGSLKPSTVEAERLSQFWKHALSSAAAAQVIASLTPVSPMLAFTTALLHDMGRLVLHVQNPSDYARVLALAEQEKLPLYLAERAVLDIDHAQVGAELLEHWRLPQNMVEAVAMHHHRFTLGEEAYRDPLGGVLVLGDLVGADIHKGHSDMSEAAAKVLPAYWLSLLDIEPPHIQALYEPAIRKYNSLCGMVIKA